MDAILGFMSSISKGITNIVDTLISFFTSVGDVLSDLAQFLAKLPSYVLAVTNILSSFIPVPVMVIIGSIFALCILKIAIGRDG